MDQEITIKQLHDAIIELKELKTQHDTAEDILSAIKSNLDAQKILVMDMLQKTGKQGEKIPGVLNVVLANNFYVAQPNSPENEQAFNGWLAENNLDALRKVHSQTLNAMYRERLEAAAEQGEIVVIPGLEPPTTKTTLRMLKG